MKITRRWAILSILLCAPAIQGLQHGSDRPAGDALTVDPAWSELNSSMRKMHVAMASVKPSGESDVDFVRLMLPHHRAAIDMASTQLLFGKDPQMRRLAQEIITDQQSEIELMKMWLKQREAQNRRSALHGSKEH